MQSTGLFLRQDQVFAGMVVALCLEGKSEPETDEDGPLLLRALVGGVAMCGLKFYPHPVEVIRDEFPGPTGQPVKGAYVRTQQMSGFKPDVRFMPVEVFSPATAPAHTDFVVFVNGESLLYPSEQARVFLRSDERRRLLSLNGYEHEWWLREYPLPADAVVVPVSKIGAPKVHAA